MQVFHENLFEIQCGQIVGSNKMVKSLFLFCFIVKSPFSFGELNYSQYFFNEHERVASLTEPVCKVSFALFKVPSE